MRSIIVALLATFLFVFSESSVIGRFKREMPDMESHWPEQFNNGSVIEIVSASPNDTSNDTNSIPDVTPAISSDTVYGDKVVLQQPTIIFMKQPLIFVDGDVQLDNMNATEITHLDNSDHDDDDGEDNDIGEHDTEEDHNDDEEEPHSENPSDVAVTTPVSSDNQTDSDVIQRHRREAETVDKDQMFAANCSFADDEDIVCSNATLMNGTDNWQHNNVDQQSVDHEPMEDSDDVAEHQNEQMENEDEEHSQSGHMENEDEEQSSTEADWSSTSQFSSTTTTSSNW